MFLAEGVRTLVQAVQHRVGIERIVVAPELLTSPAGKRVVKQLRIAGTPCLRVTNEVFHSISQAEEPQGVAAVIRQRWERLESVQTSHGLCWIAVDAIRSGGNLGTIIRTCEAVGAAGVILIGDCADPFDSTTVRASMGALFSQHIVRTSLSEFIDWKRLRSSIPLIGTAIDGATDYHTVRYLPSSLILMGCERKGLPSELKQACDILVKIPMVGKVDSLNVGVAAGLMLYEVLNQRNG